MVISAGLKLNLEDGLLPAIWEHLDLVRVYTKKRGCMQHLYLRVPTLDYWNSLGSLKTVPPDFSEPVVMRTGATVEDICRLIHKYIQTSLRTLVIQAYNSSIGTWSTNLSMR